MIKVFDYWNNKAGWVSFESYDKAKKYINEKMHDYWLMDKDNCCTCYMEIYNNIEYEVWCGEMGSWLGMGDETPYFNVYFGPRSDFTDIEFTKLNPRVDYIFL